MRKPVFLTLILPMILLLSCFNDFTTDQILKGDFVTLPGISSILTKSSRSIEVVFDRDMSSEGLENTGNYSISCGTGNLAVTGADIVPGFNNRVVSLTTMPQDAVEYTLTVINVKSATNKSVPAGGAVQSFTGYNTDRAAPVILAPLDGDTIQNLSLDIIWSVNNNAVSYTVEVAFDPGFASHISGSPFTIYAPDNTLSLDSARLTEAVTYYLRVRSDVTTAGIYSDTVRFEALSDAVYVYCPPGTTCDNTGSAGTLTNPFRTINKAVLAAKEFKINQVKVAGRGSSGPSNEKYSEMVNLLPGVSLLGGYNPGFTQRDTNIYTTIINNDGTFTLQVTGVKIPGDSLTIDGLTIEGGTNGDTYAFYVSDSTSYLTVSNNIITGGNSSSSSYGVYCIVSGSGAGTGPLFQNNQVVSGDATLSSYGISVVSGSPTIDSNSIASGTSTDDSVALYLYRSSSVISDNTAISGGLSSTGISYGVYGDNSSGETLQFSGNTIASDNPVDNDSCGMYISGGTAVLDGNTVTGGVAVSNNSYALYVTGSTIDASGNNFSTADGSYGNRTVNLANNSDGTLTGNTIQSGEITGSSWAVGIYVDSSIARISGNTISTGVDPSKFNYGIFFIGGAGFAVGNTISSNYNSFEIRTSGVALVNNDIRVFDTNNTYLYGVNNLSGTNASVIGNSIIAGGGPNSEIGITFSSNSGGTVYAGNTITVGSSSHPSVSGKAISIGGYNPLDIRNNIVFTKGDGTMGIGINEGASYHSPRHVTGNLIFDSPEALYRSNDTPSYYLTDGDNTTANIDWFNGATTYTAPIKYVGTTSASTGGTTSRIRIDSVWQCRNFHAGDVIIYDYAGTPENLTVTSADCANPYYIYFLPVRGTATGTGVGIWIDLSVSGNITLTGTPAQSISDLFVNPDEANPDYSLLSTGPAINRIACPAGNDTGVQNWRMAAADQPECDSDFPGSVFVTDHCESTFIYNSIEITGDSIGNDNGLCETGESCIFNPNTGSYPGHGSLVTASTPVTGTPSCSDIGTGGAVENVTLYKYNTNGY